MQTTIHTNAQQGLGNRSLTVFHIQLPIVLLSRLFCNQVQSAHF